MEQDFSGKKPLRILVGVDGSDEALRATRWAVALANRGGDSIRMVHAWIWPLMKVDLDPVPGVANSGLRHGAEMVLQHARQAALDAGSRADISTHLVVGDAGRVLTAEAEKADLTIVGNRGLGGIYGRLLGSTGMQLIAHAPGPVLIVRGEDRPEAPMLAPVDGSAQSTKALGTAAALADRLKAPLRIVHVVKDADDAETAEAAERILTEASAVALGAVPGLEVTTELIVARSAGKGLLRESAHARLLILSAHGKGKRPDSAAGSTANAALQHSGAPILIAR